MRGVTTQVSAPKSSTAYIMYLKKKPYTRGTASSLLRMCDILLQTFFAWSKFLTNAAQLSSVANISRPRYLKEIIIYRGRPYALKSLAVTSLSSSAANLRLFLSDP